MPDVVANLRVDQAWGSAQVMGALHRVNSGYYGATATANEGLGHPGEAYGYALGAGLKLNAPMIGAGDYLQLQANYTVGAMRYASFTANGSYSPFYVNGGNVAFGFATDGVYGGSVALGTNTGVQLTTAWSVDAAYEHFWNKQWRTSLYGGYLGTSFNSTANAIVCTSLAVAAVVPAGCSMNWNQWWVGSRTQWNVTADTYLGLDVFYQRLQSAQPGAPISAAFLGGGVSPAPNTYTAADEGSLGVRFRVHRDFYP
jgi:hypothetical protein